jgi:hypothetical protein
MERKEGGRGIVWLGDGIESVQSRDVYVGLILAVLKLGDHVQECLLN